MAGNFELKKTASGAFMFNLKAGNSQVILTSETYTSKASALNGIESVKKNAGNDARYDRRKSKNDEPYFVLTALNGEVVGRSEMYTSAAGMENGINSVKTNGPNAAIKDSTT